MIAVMTGLAWVLAALAGMLLAVFSLELLAGLLPRRRNDPALRQGSVAILIPAHDEADGIGATLEGLQRIAPLDARLLVVADNCSDDTAARARTAGAEVIERHEPAARGKGHALAFGRDHLSKEGFPPPQVVIVLDADCRVHPGSVEALVSAALVHDAPVQAVNLISADLGAAPIVQISSFAMLVKNLYRSRGMQRLGGAALLTGTGMAFPWPLFAQARLATGSIVEDLALGIEMTRAGHPPRGIDAASVRSAPAALGDALEQRTRWEHGFLETLRTCALPVLADGVRRGSAPEALLGLHLLVPPLALLLTIVAALVAVLAGLALAGASPIPAIVLAGMLAAALILVLAAWMAGGRPYLRGAALLSAPLYVLWKLPIYLGFLRKPETRWTRTPRRDS